MLSRLYSFFYKDSFEKPKENKEKERFPRAYYILDERVNKKSPQYQFVSAAANGDVTKMKILLETFSKEININQPDQDLQKKWFDGLSAAVLNGRKDSVQFLLTKRKEGAPVSITDQTFENAILGNQVDLLRILVNAANHEKLLELCRRLEGYVVTHGSTDLAAALRLPSAKILIRGLALHEKYGKEYRGKINKLELPIPPLLVTLFAERIKNIYHLELPVEPSYTHSH